MEAFNGIVESIVFKSSDTGYTVIKFRENNIIPEDKYFSIPSFEVGNISSHSSTLNCFPNWEWLTQLPLIFKL